MLERLVDQLTRSSILKDGAPLEILWHAGEPLAAGLDFFQQADLVFEPLNERVALTRTFQTNGTLINSDWCEYFLGTNARVGVSIDGPQPIHDKNRKFRNGKGSFPATLRGVRKLREHGIRLNALAVLTPSSLRQPDDIFEFFFDEGFTAVGFNVEETEGTNKQSQLLRRPEIRDAYLKFMERFLARNMAQRNPIQVREAKAVLYYLMKRSSDLSYSPDEAEMRAGRILTISRDGDVFTWSPELASGIDGDDAYFSIGNITNSDSLDDLLKSEKALNIQRQIDLGRLHCKKSCRYFNVCGSGSPANRFYENGDLSSTETLKCYFQTQAMTDLMLRMAQVSTRE